MTICHKSSPAPLEESALRYLSVSLSTGGWQFIK